MKKLMMALMMTHQRMKRWICVLIMMAMMTVTPNEEFSCYSYREDFLRKKHFFRALSKSPTTTTPIWASWSFFYQGNDEGPPPRFAMAERKLFLWRFSLIVMTIVMMMVMIDHQVPMSRCLSVFQ